MGRAAVFSSLGNHTLMGGCQARNSKQRRGKNLAWRGTGTNSTPVDQPALCCADGLHNIFTCKVIVPWVMDGVISGR